MKCLSQLVTWIAVTAVAFPATAQQPFQVIPQRQLRIPDAVDPDDMCFVSLGPRTPQTFMVVSDKRAHRIFLINEQLDVVDQLPIPKPGNIDSRTGFPWKGRRIPLIVVNQREVSPQLRAMTIVEIKGKAGLKLLPTEMPTGPNYGGCLSLDSNGRCSFYSTTEGGLIKQLEFRIQDGKLVGRLRRKWNSPICEGAVADDEHQAVYFCEEEVGIRKLSNDAKFGTRGKLIIKIGEHGVRGDLEGISMIDTGAGRGYLIASDQENNQFVVLDRQPPHGFLGSFKVKGARHTDGVDICQSAFGRMFPKGVFACHTDGPDGCTILLTPIQDLTAKLLKFHPIDPP